MSLLKENTMKTPGILILTALLTVLLSGCDDTINPSINRTWTTLESPTDKTLHDVFFTGDTNGWAVGSDVLLYTHDGQIWETSNINDANTYNFFNVHFFDDDNGVVCGENTAGEGIIFYTRNGGASWNEADISGSIPASFTNMNFVDANTGYVLGDGQLWKTTNGGTSWQQLNSLPDNPIALDAIGNNIWTGRSTIRFSADAGENWVNQNIDIGDKLINTLYFVNETIGYAGTSFGGGDIYQTLDGGQSWEKVYSDDDFISDFFFTSNTNGWALLGSELLHTENGSTWDKAGFTGDNYLNALFFVDKNTGYAVGYNGTILKYE